jgi:hypothetical protein
MLHVGRRAPPQPAHEAQRDGARAQTASCAEAKYFLAHCLNMKMDGEPQTEGDAQCQTSNRPAM